MKQLLTLVALVACLAGAVPAGAKGHVVVHRGPRGRAVVVHRGFPLARPLPRVIVRHPLARFRVEPRVYLPRVVFGAVVVATRPGPRRIAWRGAETLAAADGWTEVQLDVNQVGARLDFEIGGVPAAISFAEVVFDNGDTRVVDFADKRYSAGYYALLDFGAVRRVDHVRVVARAETATGTIALHLVG